MGNPEIAVSDSKFAENANSLRKIGQSDSRTIRPLQEKIVAE
jgi:hypothetical protein